MIPLKETEIILRKTEFIITLFLGILAIFVRDRKEIDLHQKDSLFWREKEKMW